MCSDVIDLPPGMVNVISGLKSANMALLFCRSRALKKKSKVILSCCGSSQC